MRVKYPIMSLCMLCAAAAAAQDVAPGDDPLLDEWSFVPLRADHELFIGATIDAGGLGSGLAMAYPRTGDDAAAPALYRRFEQRTLLAGDAGPIMGTPFDQLALVVKEAGGFFVDVYSGMEPGAVHIGRHELPDACGSSGDNDCRSGDAFAVLVADLDAFDASRPDLDSSQRDACPATNRWHAEVAVAYPWRDAFSGEERIRVEMLSWEDVERASADAPPDPPSWTHVRLTEEQVQSTARLRLRAGQLFDGAVEPEYAPETLVPDLLVAYPGMDSGELKVRMEGWRLRRSVEDTMCTDASPPDREVSSLDFSTSNGVPADDDSINTPTRVLTERISDARAWDTVIADPEFVGLLTDDDGNQVDGLDMAVSVWTEPEGSEGAGKLDVRVLVQNVAGGGGLIERDGNDLLLGRLDADNELLIDPAQPMQAVAGRTVTLGDNINPDGSNRCTRQGVYVLVHTQKGPVIQSLFLGGRSDTLVEVVKQEEGQLSPLWPDSQVLQDRPGDVPGGVQMVSGGFVRDRARPDFGQDERCEDADAAPSTGFNHTLYVVQPEGNGVTSTPTLDVLSIFNQPSNFTQWLTGRFNTRSVPLVTMPSAATNVGSDFVTVNMDVDGDGQVRADTDGPVILNYLMGLRGAAMTSSGGLLGADATRDTAAVEAYLDANRGALDIDDDGIADGLSDGLTRLRHIQGETGQSLVGGVCPGCDPQAVADYLAGPDDWTIEAVPVMVAVDGDGDQARHEIDVDDEPDRFVGRGSTYRINDIESYDVILAEPPKHVDWLPSLGGVTNISNTAEFFSEFETTQQQSEEISRETSQDWTVSETESKTESASVGVDLFGAVSAGAEGSISTEVTNEFDTSTSNFQSQQSSLSFTQINTATRDDQVVSRVFDMHVWRYPAMGPIADAEQDGRPKYFEIHQSTQPSVFFSGGRTNDNYQPWHQNHNVLSYPVFEGDSFEPASDEVGEFAIDGELRIEPLWSESGFTVGGLSFEQRLEFVQNTTNEETFSSSNTVTEVRDTTVSGSVSAAGSFRGIGVSGGYSQERSWSASESWSYSQTRVSSNTVSESTTIRLVIPGDIVGERGYRFHPSWFFTPDGGLKLTHAVALEGMGTIPEVFWDTHYADPDPALNMPFRFTLDANTPVPDIWLLNTDPTRDSIKGMILRDGAGIPSNSPALRRGEPLSFAPRVGDRVQIEVRVYNLSVATPVDDLKVRFEAQRFELGEEVGPRRLIAERRIDRIPYRGQSAPDPEDPLSELGHVRRAFALWDTSGFGPDSPDELATWKIYVTLDPDNEIPGEVHELVDRYDDPLLSPQGEPLDPVPGQPGVYLEKGQNNSGWGLVRVASPAAEGGTQRSNDTPVTTVADLELLDETVRAGSDANLRLTVAADRLVRERKRVLIHEGSLEQGGEVISALDVMGLDPGGIDRRVRWRPDQSGRHRLRVTVLDADEPGDGHNTTSTAFTVDVE